MPDTGNFCGISPWFRPTHKAHSQYRHAIADPIRLISRPLSASCSLSASPQRRPAFTEPCAPPFQPKPAPPDAMTVDCPVSKLFTISNDPGTVPEARSWCSLATVKPYESIEQSQDTKGCCDPQNSMCRRSWNHSPHTEKPEKNFRGESDNPKNNNPKHPKNSFQSYLCLRHGESYQRQPVRVATPFVVMIDPAPPIPTLATGGVIEICQMPPPNEICMPRLAIPNPTLPEIVVNGPESCCAEAAFVKLMLAPAPA
jgi:hypothetical protein